MNAAQLIVSLLRKRRVAIKGRVITMFDLLVKLLNAGKPIVNAKVDVSYNGTSKQAYTDINGEAIFTAIPASIRNLSVVADVAGGWIRELRLIEDWEALIALEPKIVEDWEKLVELALQITEDWEEIVALSLRITEDWEEIAALALQLTEDWEEDYTLTEVFTTYFDDMTGFSKDDLATYGFNAVTPTCVAAHFGSGVAMRPLESGSTGTIDTASIYTGAAVKFGKAEAYIGMDWKDVDPDTGTFCNAGYSFDSASYGAGLVVWRFDSLGIAIIVYIDVNMYSGEQMVQHMDVIFFSGDYNSGDVRTIELPETIKSLGDRFYLAAEIKPAAKPYLLINFEGNLYAVEIPDSHVPATEANWGICASGEHVDADGNYLQPVVDIFKLSKYE